MNVYISIYVGYIGYILVRGEYMCYRSNHQAKGRGGMMIYYFKWTIEIELNYILD